MIGRRLLMSAKFTMAFNDDGSLTVRMAGKLRGHAAREGLEFLRHALELNQRNIRLDLRDITSVDSIGKTIFNWIRGRNGNRRIDMIQPAPDFESDRLASITPSEFLENGIDGCSQNKYREEIA